MLGSGETDVSDWAQALGHKALDYHVGTNCECSHFTGEKIET